MTPPASDPFLTPLWPKEYQQASATNPLVASVVNRLKARDTSLKSVSGADTEAEIVDRIMNEFSTRDELKATQIEARKANGDSDDEDVDDDDDGDDDDESVYTDDDGLTAGFEELDDADKAEFEDAADFIEQFKEITFGDEFVKINNETMSMEEYLGEEFEQHIHELDNVTPMEIPDGMALEPHPWQLKGAMQAHFCCTEKPWKGLLVGDEPGVGKTMLGALIAHLAKEERGSAVLIVCPKHLCEQWRMQLAAYWKEGHQPSVMILKDSKMSALTLYSHHKDVWIASYNFVESCFRSWTEYHEGVEAHRAGKRADPPPRPSNPLFSNFWTSMQLPIKRLILDECQYVSNHTGKRYEAAEMLYRSATVPMSGTLLANRWYDVYGPLSFLRGHPFKTWTQFVSRFTTKRADGHLAEPSGKYIRFLQRFLMAFTIARPSSMLKLPRLEEFRVRCRLYEAEALDVIRLTEEFKTAIAKMAAVQQSAKKTKDQKKANRHSKRSPLRYAVRAQVRSLSFLCARRRGKGIGQTGEIDFQNPMDLEVLASDEACTDSAVRVAWLKDVESHSLQELRESSGRLDCFIELWKYVRVHHAGQKIVVFSKYLKFLDIIAHCLWQLDNKEAFRIDGTVAPQQRTDILRLFEEEEGTAVLLMTGDAGGTGFNIAFAAVVIQTEVWWNRNTELQAMLRVFRQGAKHDVFVYRLSPTNCLIDEVIYQVQQRKAVTNQTILSAVIRPYDEKPNIPPVYQSTVGRLRYKSVKGEMEKLRGQRKGAVDQDGDATMTG